MNMKVIFWMISNMEKVKLNTKIYQNTKGSLNLIKNKVKGFIIIHWILIIKENFLMIKNMEKVFLIGLMKFENWDIYDG